MSSEVPLKTRNIEGELCLAAALLVCLGLVMSYSSSYAVASMEAVSPSHFFTKQLVAAVLGCLALVTIRWLPRPVVRGLAPAALGAGLVLLIAVLFLGSRVRGAQGEDYHRWFAWHGISFQPSEFAKLALVMGLAWLGEWYACRKDRYNCFLFVSMAFVGLYFLLIAFEPDLGVAVLMVLAGVAVIFAAGARPSHLFAFAAVGAGLLLVLAFGESAGHDGTSGENFLGHLVSRVTAWATPGIDLNNPEEYQAWLCLLAMGSGGVFGKGLCKSVFKFGYLPARHTDSVIAIVGEEIGLVGTIGVVLLFVWLARTGFSIAGRSKDPFSRLLAFGLTAFLAGQAALNVLVATYTLPTIGEPLPFVSYGGTSLVMSLAAVGLLLHLARPTPVSSAPPAPIRKVRGNANSYLQRRNRRTRLSRPGDR